LAHLACGLPMFGILAAIARHGSPDVNGRVRRVASVLVALGGSWFLWAALRNA
jgi:hypothetical protein